MYSILPAIYAAYKGGAVKLCRKGRRFAALRKKAVLSCAVCVPFGSKAAKLPAKFRRAACFYQPAVIYNGYPAAQIFGFFYIMGCKHNGYAFAVQSAY